MPEQPNQQQGYQQPAQPQRQPYPQPQQPRPQQPQQPQPQPQQPRPQQYPQQQYPQQQQQQYRQPVQQQQTYQQPAQTPQPTPQQQQPPGLHPDHKRMFILGGILLLIFVGVGIFQLIGPSEETSLEPIITEPTTTETTTSTTTEAETTTTTTTTPETTTTTETDTTTTTTATAEDVVEFDPAEVETFGSAELTIDKFLFASDIDENFEYTALQNNSVYSYQTVYLYIEPSGYGYVPERESVTIDLTEDLEVKDPDGVVVPYLTKQGLLRVTDNPSDALAISNEFNFDENAKEGVYTVTVLIRDAIKKTATTKTATFTLEHLVFVDTSLQNVTI